MIAITMVAKVNISPIVPRTTIAVRVAAVVAKFKSSEPRASPVSWKVESDRATGWISALKFGEAGMSSKLIVGV